MPTTETMPPEDPRKPDPWGLALRKMEEEREEMLRWLAEDGPISEDLMDFLI